MVSGKVNTPASYGGIVRYFSEYKSKLEFKPGTVIILAVIVVLITIVLHIYGSSFLGL